MTDDRSAKSQPYLPVNRKIKQSTVFALNPYILTFFEIIKLS